MFVRKQADGKVVAILDGYTYYLQTQSKKTARWQCTLGNVKCKAKFNLKTTGEMYKREAGHNHAPPIFTIINGYYVKL